MKYLNSTASVAVKAGAGTILGFLVNSHSSGTLRFNDGANGTTASEVKATQTLTSTGVFEDGDIIVAGDKTYTMKTALSTSPTVANEVLIGASAAISLDNLKLAINAGAGEGTNYSTGTQANPNVTATTNTNTTQVVEAIIGGTAGNSIVTTETGANIVWGAGTLAGGIDLNALIFNTITFANANEVFMLGEGIEFESGLYATIGGTIDYTVIYK